MTLMLALSIALAALVVGDVILTNRLIKAGGTEKNPLVRWVMERLGSSWWMVKIPIAAAAILVAANAVEPWGYVGLGVAAAVHLYAVVHNWRQLRT